MFPSKADAERAGWFSRRHQTRDGLDGARQVMENKRRQKFDDAQERNEATAKLPPQERIARLDALFGEGQGAKRERAKLQTRIDAGQKPATSKTKEKE